MTTIPPTTNIRTTNPKTSAELVAFCFISESPSKGDVFVVLEVDVVLKVEIFVTGVDKVLSPDVARFVPPLVPKPLPIVAVVVIWTVDTTVPLSVDGVTEVAPTLPDVVFHDSRDS